MRLVWLLLTLVVALDATSLNHSENADGKRIRYDNFSVYKLHIKNKIQLKIVGLVQNYTDEYNTWKEYDELTKEIHIMVSPKELPNFKQFLDMFHIDRELMVANVQKLIDDEQSVTTKSESFGWTRYYKLHEIEAWLDEILSTYPTYTEGFTIGKSYEGRAIRGIRISYKSDNPGIFIESNIHAREWITSASATWFIYQLLTSQDPIVRNLAENYDWYIIPVFNVDGFVYSHETDRMWRKTRQPHNSSPCIGVDANRNFDSHWMEGNGASGNPCDETFAGSMPWSEPETKALAEYVRSIKDKLKIYLSFHSYGQWLLSPFGHTALEFPENYEDLQSIGSAFTNAVKSLSYGTEYIRGSTGSTLYVASGVSVDWMFNELKFEVGYTIEFRDKGRYGFVLPPVQIIPNCEELLTGMIALLDKAKELQYV